MNDRDTQNDIREQEMKTIGKRLKDLRENYRDANGKKLNQEDFASLIDLGKAESSKQSMLSLIESGKKYPTVPQLLKYCELFNVSADFILKGEQQTNSRPSAAITAADLCNEIMQLDECQLIDIVANGNRYGILFRDLSADIAASTDEPPVVEQLKAAYTDTMLCFLNDLDAIKQAMKSLSDLSFGYDCRIEQLAKSGILADARLVGSLNTTDLLAEIEQHETARRKDDQKKRETALEQFKAERQAENSVALEKALSIIRSQYGEITATASADADNDKGQQD